MQNRFLGALIASALAASLSAQATITPSVLGTGKDGAFAPTADVTIDTDQQACWEFRSFNIPKGVTVTAIGSKMLHIKCLSAVVIDGTLNLNGSAGASGGNNAPGGAGGAGGAGGGTGGTGGASTAAPFVGTGLDGTGPGTRGGIGGKDAGPVPGTFTDPVGGGGGGANATDGAMGGPPNAGGTTQSGAGGKKGPCRGGGGGGGGGGDIDSATVATSNDGGGGGGGGGGWVHFDAATITINGAINADGGAGGTSTGNGGGGGGGAGGTIDMNAATVTNNGTLSAVGGAAGAATQSNCGCSPGGKGGDGCINVIGGVYSGSGTSTPKPNTLKPMICLTESCCIDLAISAGSATTKYLTGVGVIPLNPPWNSPWGTVYTLDDFFLITLFANSAPPVLTNSNGTGAGIMTLCYPAGIKGLPVADVPLIIQSITLDSGGGINGVSNKVDVVLKL